MQLICINGLKMRGRIIPSLVLGASLVLGIACDGDGDGHDSDHDHDHDHDHNHETEVISKVTLTFTPASGGDSVVASFSDPDGDGGVSGESEPIVLQAGVEYTLDITLTNELEMPAIDITEEIRREAEEHFVFVYGDGVTGPASQASAPLVTHAYADVESDYGANEVGDDLPLGLVNTITANTAGTSTLKIMQRHLPPSNGNSQKTADLPKAFAEGDALPGDVDIDVSFELTVE